MNKIDVVVFLQAEDIITQYKISFVHSWPFQPNYKIVNHYSLIGVRHSKRS